MSGGHRPLTEPSRLDTGTVGSGSDSVLDAAASLHEVCRDQQPRKVLELVRGQDDGPRRLSPAPGAAGIPIGPAPQQIVNYRLTACNRQPMIDA